MKNLTYEQRGKIHFLVQAQNAIANAKYYMAAAGVVTKDLDTLENIARNLQVEIDSVWEEK